MSPMLSPAQVRKAARVLWAITTNDFGRKLKRMGNIRPELSKVVHSHLSDQAAVDHVRPFVRENPDGAKAAKAWVSDMRRDDGGYIADRYYRILVAVITDTPPRPIAPQNAERYARERELGWMPLEDAFAVIATAVPEVAAIAASPTSSPDLRWSDELHRVIGPGSRHPDPVMRSSLAVQIAVTYLLDRDEDPEDPDLRRPVWGRHRTSRTFTIGSSSAPNTARPDSGTR
jgi:hypothetical protein